MVSQHSTHIISIHSMQLLDLDYLDICVLSILHFLYLHVIQVHVILQDHVLLDLILKETNMLLGIIQEKLMVESTIFFGSSQYTGVWGWQGGAGGGVL